MSATVSEQAIQNLEVIKDQEINAPIEIVFEAILEQMGPANAMPDGTPLHTKLEAWPGGRWYRDLGNNTGHYWGTVQSIKPPALLEIQGPLFMSGPVISHVIYRLTSENGVTRIKFSHRAMGLIAAEHMDGGRIGEGWLNMLTKIRQASERKTKAG